MKGNALIKETQLGYCGGNLLTCFLILEQPGQGQGFGGYRLNAPVDNPHWSCGFWIKRIIDTVGVENWENLKGKYIRIDGEDFGEIRAIGHIVEDKWFNPEKEMAEMKEKLEAGK